MKRSSIPIIFFSMLLATSAFCQSVKRGSKSGLVHATSIQYAEGTVSVSATGFAKKIQLSKEDAIAEAVYVVLFRGVPGTEYNTPLIENEAKYKEHAAVKEILNGGYGSFVTRINEISSEKKKRKSDGIKGYETVLHLTVNCDALRRFLVKREVIRKFGF